MSHRKFHDIHVSIHQVNHLQTGPIWEESLLHDGAMGFSHWPNHAAKRKDYKEGLGHFEKGP